MRGGDKGHKDLTFRAICGMAIKFCVQNMPLKLIIELYDVAHEPSRLLR